MNRTLLPSLTALVILLYGLSLAIGPAWWPWRLGNELGWAIVWELRVPRATLGLLIGGALGLSGAVLQGWLRNPLAEPGVIGVSSCAGFAAVCAFYSGLAAAFTLALPLAGILGASIAVALLMSAVRSGTGTVSLLLMGVAINAIAAAAIALVLALSPNPFAYQEISLWLAGSIVDRDLSYLAIATPFLLMGGVLVLGAGRWLDALSLGEDTASSLGADSGSIGLRLTLGVGLMVGAATSVAGVRACAVLQSGGAVCWGATPRPVPVVGESGTGELDDVVEVSVGPEHTCARLADGQARCWGGQAGGRLGNGVVASSSVATPQVVLGADGTSPITGLTSIDSGWDATCAAAGDGQAWCWGRSLYDALGIGTTAPWPFAVAVLSRP